MRYSISYTIGWCGYLCKRSRIIRSQGKWARLAKRRYFADGTTVIEDRYAEDGLPYNDGYWIEDSTSKLKKFFLQVKHLIGL